MNAEKLIESGYLQKMFQDSNVRMDRQCEGSNWKYLEADRTFCLYEWILFIISRQDNIRLELSIMPNNTEMKNIICWSLRDDKAKRDCLKDLFDEGIMFEKVACIKWIIFSTRLNIWHFNIYLCQEENK